MPGTFYERMEELIYRGLRTTNGPEEALKDQIDKVLKQVSQPQNQGQEILERPWLYYAKTILPKGTISKGMSPEGLGVRMRGEKLHGKQGKLSKIQQVFGRWKKGTLKVAFLAAKIGTKRYIHI